MAVKVLITRRFKEGQGLKLLSLLNRLRSQAMAQDGYITGETLVGVDDPRKLVIISTWESLDHWERWKSHQERANLEGDFVEVLSEPTGYEVFSFGSFPHR